MSAPRQLGTIALIAAVLHHLLVVLSPAWLETRTNEQGRDFASYYYAIRVAADGGDPYDTKQLSATARKDGSRRGVHPFLYAPPFLLSMAWAPGFDLGTAYHRWFWLHELCLVAAVMVLAGWTQRLGDEAPWVLAVLVATMTAIPNNHVMGQANFPGLALAIGGIWATDRGRPWLGGALLGTACMLKMAPALLVLWWILRKEHQAVVASVVTAVVLSVLTLPYASVDVQLGFYRDVLPTFSSGGYNGLAVPIGMYGNHSLPNVFHQWFPSGRGTLSSAARLLALLGNLSLLVGLAVAFRKENPDPLQRLGQVGAVSVVMLLFPVYTYEHHLVWTLPASLAAVMGVLRGRLPGPWAVLVGVGIALVAFELAALKRFAEVPGTAEWMVAVIRESKTVGLLALLAATVRMGAVTPTEDPT
jgi:hypothetical protein